MSDSVLASLSNGVYHVTLNNPGKHNCMGMEMLNALEKAAEESLTNEEIKVVVFKGAGDKAFSSGANLKEFNRLEDTQIDHWILEGNRIFNFIETLPKPTIAVLNGYTLGGGLELALCCDFRIGIDNTLIGSPEVKNGWLPGWGAMTRLRRLIGEAAAKRVILLSENLGPQEAYDLGILTRVYETSRLAEDLEGFIAPLLALNNTAYGQAKIALMEDRTTAGTDLHFDVMSARLAKKKNLNQIIN